MKHLLWSALTAERQQVVESADTVPAGAVFVVAAGIVGVTSSVCPTTVIMFGMDQLLLKSGEQPPQSGDLFPVEW
jgi:hypothetical protein